MLIEFRFGGTERSRIVRRRRTVSYAVIIQNREAAALRQMPDKSRKSE
jgi:hypothetical protein